MKSKHSTALRVIAPLFLAVGTTIALAQVPTNPPSSIPGPSDPGQLAHTNLQILTTSTDITETHQYYGPPFKGYLYQTPASLGCIYHLIPALPTPGPTPALPNCNPNVVTVNPEGGAKAIAIVDAFDDPNAYADLQYFSGQFGIAAINPSSFIVVYAPHGGSTVGSCTGAATQPLSAKGTGWDVEESLDVQWAHAMAPLATLFLVEAQSNSFSDLNCAVTVAGNIVSAQGGGEVSMSWGSGEFPSETSFDSVFTTPKIVYFASAGDSPGVSYPAASPNVVSVGGTSVSYNAITGNFIGENTWQATGGGVSAFEPRPAYQNGIASIVGTHRGTPDIASDANPYTGVWVFDSLTFGAPVWFVVGGTSVSSPTWAGIVNTAGTFAASSGAELTKLYGDHPADFTDITSGDCGPYMGHFASGGWDLCSGFGSPKKYDGK